jgi:hypothetical protein
LRIRLQSDGGFGFFPGLNEPVIVDTADLPPGRAAGLERLVAAADFFGRPEQAGAPAPGPGAADQRHYTITVEDDDGRSRTVEMTEPVEDAALMALIDSVRGAARSGGDQ